MSSIRIALSNQHAEKNTDVSEVKGAIAFTLVLLKRSEGTESQHQATLKPMSHIDFN